MCEEIIASERVPRGYRWAATVPNEHADREHEMATEVAVLSLMAVVVQGPDKGGSENPVPRQEEPFSWLKVQLSAEQLQGGHS